MKKKLVIATVVVGTILLLAWMASVATSRVYKEPRYKGRPARAWARDLGNSDENVRLAAVDALKAMGPGAAAYFGQTMVRDESLAHRFGRSLMNHSPRLIQGKLREYLHDSLPRANSLRAARALEMIGPEATNALPELEKALHHADPIISSAAALALARLKEPGVSALTNGLTDPVQHVREASYLGLNQIGTAGGAAVPALMRLLRDVKNPEHTRALLALTQIREPAVPALTAALTETNATVRALAAQALGAMNVFAQDAIPALVAQVEQDPAPEVRRAIARALGQIQPFSEPSSTALLKLMSDADAETRLNAMGAIPSSPRLMRSVIPTLGRLLEDPDPRVRTEAAKAAGYLSERAISLIAKLEVVAQSQDHLSQQAAINALDSIRKAQQAQNRQK